MRPSEWSRPLPRFLDVLFDSDIAVPLAMLEAFCEHS